MFQPTKFWILVVAAFVPLSSAVEYKLLPTQLSGGIIDQDFAFPFELVHEHERSLYNKIYLEPKEIYPEYNFHVSIERGEEAICSGAIVYGGQHVVTAASCDVKPTDIVRINAPKLFRSHNSKVLGIKCIKIHPRFHTNVTNHRFDYDIAIIQLNETITTQTALYPNSLGYLPSEGKVTHYSTLARWRYKNSLIVTKVPIFSAAVCRKDYSFYMTNNMICAGAYSPKTPFCFEDRGSPLFVGGTLIGVKSWGEQCSRSIYPTVFTDVSTVQQWILDAIQSPNC